MRPPGSASPSAPASARFVWDDPFLLEDQLTEDERAIRDVAQSFAQEQLLPGIVEAYADEIADAVDRVARPLLLSGAVGVHVNPGLTPTDGTVTVFAGYQTAATATYERIGDDDRPSEARL